MLIFYTKEINSVAIARVTLKLGNKVKLAEMAKENGTSASGVSGT